MYCGLTWLIIKAFMQKFHALSYEAAENNCFDAWGTLVQTSAGLAWPLYLIHC